MKNSKTNYLNFIKSQNELNILSKNIIDIVKKNKIQFILLSGEIGSGKTTLIKQIALNLKEEKTVVSPTFNKMIIYNDFVHIDAYNLKNDSLESYSDYFEDRIVIIEWAENLIFDFEKFIKIDIKFINDTKRQYEIYWKV